MHFILLRVCVFILRWFFIYIFAFCCHFVRYFIRLYTHLLASLSCYLLMCVYCTTIYIYMTSPDWDHRIYFDTFHLYNKKYIYFVFIYFLCVLLMLLLVVLYVLRSIYLFSFFSSFSHIALSTLYLRPAFTTSPTRTTFCCFVIGFCVCVWFRGPPSTWKSRLFGDETVFLRASFNHHLRVKYRQQQSGQTYAGVLLNVIGSWNDNQTSIELARRIRICTKTSSNIFLHTHNHSLSQRNKQYEKNNKNGD